MRNRAAQFIIKATQQRDWFGLILFGMLISVAVAAVSILFSQTMKEAALKRFQLASDSFPLWAVHQSVPAMYNFENRVRFSNVISDGGVFDESEKSYFQKTVNHFPARSITFAGQRSVLLHDKEGMFEMRSVFGDTALISRWNVTRDSSGHLTVHRVAQTMNRQFERASVQSDRAVETRGSDE